jgi:hypothetical protein
LTRDIASVIGGGGVVVGLETCDPQGANGAGDLEDHLHGRRFVALHASARRRNAERSHNGAAGEERRRHAADIRISLATVEGVAQVPDLLEIGP